MNAGKPVNLDSRQQPSRAPLSGYSPNSHGQRNNRWTLTDGLMMILRLLFVAMAAPSASASDKDDSRPVDFNFQIRPILSDKCFNCHGPDPRNRKAGLRLDTQEGAFATNKSGTCAVVAGDLESSELYQRVTATEESERMPPRSLGRSLSADEVALLKRWIEQGAQMEVALGV